MLNSTGMNTAPAAGGALPPKPPVKGGRAIRPFTAIKNYWPMGLLAFVLVLLVGLPAAWVKGTASWYTEGVIRVSARFAKNLEEDVELQFQSNSQYREFVQQQVRTINRYDIVFEALERLGDRRFVWQDQEESLRRATERLQGALSIRPVPDTYLITVGLQAGDPDGLAEVVNSVMEVFVEKAGPEEFYATNQRLDRLRDERTRLADSLNQTAQRRADIAQELGVTTFNEALLNPYDQLLLGAKEALESARRNTIVAEAELFAWNPDQNPEGRAALEAEAEKRVAQDPGLNSLKANLNLRRSQLLQKSSGLTEDHPGRKAAERELEEIEQELENRRAELLASISGDLFEEKQTRVMEAKRIQGELLKQVEEQSVKARHFADLYHEAIELGWESERVRSRLKSVENRIDFLSLEDTAPGFVRVVSEARVPEIPLQGGRKVLFLLVAAAACALAIVVPVAFDFFDPRIQATSDVEKVLGVPLLGYVPLRKGSREDESFDSKIRAAALALQRDYEGKGSRVIVVTSTEPNAGTSYLSSQLGKALGDLGSKVLVIGANPLSLKSEPVQSVSSLASFLSGSVPLQSAVKGSGEGPPDRIATGPVEPSKRLKFFQRLLSTLPLILLEYQVVLIDTAPLLKCPEAEVLLERADVSLIVVRAGSFSRQSIRETARKVDRTGCKAVGIILNRVVEGSF